MLSSASLLSDPCLKSQRLSPSSSPPPFLPLHCPTPLVTHLNILKIIRATHSCARPQPNHRNREETVTCPSPATSYPIVRLQSPPLGLVLDRLSLPHEVFRRVLSPLQPTRESHLRCQTSLSSWTLCVSSCNSWLWPEILPVKTAPPLPPVCIRGLECGGHIGPLGVNPCWDPLNQSSNRNRGILRLPCWQRVRGGTWHPCWGRQQQGARSRGYHQLRGSIRICKLARPRRLRPASRPKYAMALPNPAWYLGDLGHCWDLSHRLRPSGLGALSWPDIWHTGSKAGQILHAQGIFGPFEAPQSAPRRQSYPYKVMARKHRNIF